MDLDIISYVQFFCIPMAIVVYALSYHSREQRKLKYKIRDREINPIIPYFKAAPPPPPRKQAPTVFDDENWEIGDEEEKNIIQQIDDLGTGVSYVDQKLKDEFIRDIISLTKAQNRNHQA